MKKLKIGLVLDDSLDKTDGVQQYVLIMGRWLAKQGHDVHYLVGQTRRTDLPNIHSLSRNVAVRFNQNRMAMPLPAHMGQIRQLLAHEQFDVLHIQVPYSPALAGRIICAVGPKTAVVGMFHVLPHSRWVTAANYVLGHWARHTLRRFDAMMANSAPTRDFAKKTMHINAQIVPLPITLEQFEGAKPFAKYKNKSVVMFLGRLVERKGCQYLLKAVVEIVAAGKWPDDAVVVICGDGHLRPKLEEYVKAHKLDGIVEFTGFISESDKPRYFASSKVVVYPSTGGESFGVVLLEAMAASHGVVLAGNNPGYASVMSPHPSSLFDPHDTKTLAAKIIAALKDTPENVATINWQEVYVKQFAISKVGHRTVEIYESCISKLRGQ